MSGILIASQIAELPPLLWATAILPLLLFKKTSIKIAPLLWLCLGFGFALARAEWILKQQLPDILQGKDVEVIGTVVGLPDVYSDSVRFEFDVDTLSHQQQRYAFTARIRLRWYNNESKVLPGQRWRLTVRLKRTRGFHNPQGFDYEAWLFQRGIRATGYVRTSQHDLLDSKLSFGIANNLRAEILAFIHNRFPSTDAAAMLAALTVGYRTDISPPLWAALRNTGTIHLMAISGLHIGLVFGAVYGLMSFCWRRIYRAALLIPAQTAAIMIGWVAALMYSALAGFSIPTQRALIMLTVVAVAHLIQRRAISSNTLALALFIVLLVDPWSVLSAGFWLSFIAVAVIVLTIANMRPTTALEDKSRVGVLINRWTSVQFAIAIGLAPVLLVWFQQVSIIAPLVNLVVIPLVGFFVVPVALIGVLAALVRFNAVAEILLSIDLKVLQLVANGLYSAGNMDLATVLIQPPTPMVMCLALAGIGLLLAPAAIPYRWLGSFALLPLLFPLVQTPKTGQAIITVLDVGQGLAIVVQTTNRTLLFDTGPSFGSHFNAASAVILPFLHSRGIANLDTLIVSHDDSDHAGGVATLRAEMKIDKVFVGSTNKSGKSESCHAFTQWQWSGIDFQFLTVKSDKNSNENNRSCVLKVSSATGSILITGDIEAKAEQILVNRMSRQIDADILIVPHHGSRTSSTVRFVDAVSPQFAVISSGYQNRFGHPHVDVLSRYAERDIVVYNTAIDGAVSLHLSQSGIKITTHKATSKRIWHGQ